MKTDAVIRRIQADELPALLELYTHLHPSDDPLPDSETLQKVWTSIYGDLGSNAWSPKRTTG